MRPPDPASGTGGATEPDRPEVIVERRSPAEASEEEVVAFQCLLQACYDAGDTTRVPPTLSDVMSGYYNPPTFAQVWLWVARRRSSGVIGAAQGVAFSADNPHVLMVDHFRVAATHRRRGVASAILAGIVETAQATGRTLLVGPTQGSATGEAFCRSLGAEALQGMKVHRLDLGGLDRSLLRRWVSEGEANVDYELVAYDGPCPEEWLDEVVDVLQVMNDAPREGLATEDHPMTSVELREREAMDAGAGTQRWWLFARHRVSRALVGLTEVSWYPERPEQLLQGDTGVRPEHRGHGLGKWLKAAMLERVLDERSDVDHVETANADSNAPMLAINTRLGFREHSQRLVWQLEVERARAYLNARGR